MSDGLPVRSVKLLVTTGVLAALLTACGTDITGGVTVLASRYTCTTSRYSDIREGAQVTVYDDVDRLIASSHLGAGVNVGDDFCRFPFALEGIPSAGFYQVEVSHRGRVTFSAEDIAKGVELSLG